MSLLVVAATVKGRKSTEFTTSKVEGPEVPVRETDACLKELINGTPPPCRREAAAGIFVGSWKSDTELSLSYPQQMGQHHHRRPSLFSLWW